MNSGLLSDDLIWVSVNFQQVACFAVQLIVYMLAAASGLLLREFIRLQMTLWT